MKHNHSLLVFPLAASLTLLAACGAVAPRPDPGSQGSPPPGPSPSLADRFQATCDIATEAVDFAQPFVPLLHSADDQARARVVIRAVQDTCANPPKDDIGVAAAIAALYVDISQLKKVGAP